MKRGFLFLLLLLIAWFSGCAGRLPPPASSAVPQPAAVSLAELPGRIDEVLAQKLGPGTLASIKVVSLARGDTLYGRQSNLLLLPASNLKLFTAAAALSLLGADYPMETTVSRGGDGTLYLRGCGDPLITDIDYGVLAKKASENLPKGAPLRLVGDFSCFDDRYWGEGWMWDDEPDPEEVYLSALAINGNAVSVTVTAGAAAGLPATVTLEPSTGLVSIVGAVATTAGKEPCAPQVTRPAGDRENRVEVSGAIAAECAPSVTSLSVWQPERVALDVFRSRLSADGVSVTEVTTGATPPDAAPIAVMSRPVRDAVRAALKKSNNLAAESLLKTIGRKATGRPGTAADGITAVKEALRQWGIRPELLQLADGSGVSRYNLVTAQATVALLSALHRDRALASDFLGALPVAGRDGTLRRRMKGTPAEGKVRAKTGTLRGVSTLSGYAETADGEPLVFALFLEHFLGPPEEMEEVQDRIAALLSVVRR